MKAFYLALMEKLEAAEFVQHLQNKGITPVRYIDLYRQQEYFEESFYLLGNTVLVEWQIDHNDIPAIATITLHCGYEQLQDTGNLSQNREHALRFFDYYKAIDQLARTIETAETGKLSLFSEGQDKMDSIIDMYLLTYQCTYTPKEEENTPEGMFETLDVKGNLKKQLEPAKESMDNPYDFGL